MLITKIEHFKREGGVSFAFWQVKSKKGRGDKIANVVGRQKGSNEDFL